MTRFSSTLALGAALVLGLWATARADGATIAEVFAGKVVPTTITCKDVTAEWQQFTLTPGQESSHFSQIFTMMLASSYKEKGALLQLLATLYSKGETLDIMGEQYLVAYRLETPQTAALVKQLAHPYEEIEAGNMGADYITEKTLLQLCLINLRDAGHFMGIRPAAIQDELKIANADAAHAQYKADQYKSTKNIRQIVAAMLMYAQDNGGNIPKLASSRDFSQFTRYLGTEKMLLQPGTNELYRINLALSGKAEAAIKQPTEVPSVYEAYAWPDGWRAVGYLDGHTRMVDKDEWEWLQKKWKLESLTLPVAAETQPAGEKTEE